MAWYNRVGFGMVGCGKVQFGFIIGPNRTEPGNDPNRSETRYKFVT